MPALHYYYYYLSPVSIGSQLLLTVLRLQQLWLQSSVRPTSSTRSSRMVWKRGGRAEEGGEGGVGKKGVYVRLYRYAVQPPYVCTAAPPGPQVMRRPLAAPHQPASVRTYYMPAHYLPYRCTACPARASQPQTPHTTLLACTAMSAAVVQQVKLPWATRFA